MGGRYGCGRSLLAEQRRTARLRRRVKQAEDRAAGREAALATLSHEMREPLNGVAGLAHLLKETQLDAEQRGYVEAIVESADTLVTLVNDLLDLARIDSGKLALAAVGFSPRHLLDSVRRMLEARATARGLAFTVECAAAVPERLLGDPGRLRQVLVNLVGNAIKFTDEGEVRVRATLRPADRGAGADLEIAVEDTGIGMDPACFARLDAPFAQADARIGRLYGGSGLGLLISRRIVAAMDGTIGCSRGASGGTRLTVTLPAQIAHETSRDRAACLTGAALLVVDPLERTRTTIRDLTRLWGLDVRAVRTGREALPLLLDAATRQRPFDVVLIDAALTDPRAEELAAWIRRDPRLAAARLALQAPAGFRGDAARAGAAGFAAYLPKPIDPELLRDCLQRLLEGVEDGELLTAHRLAETRRSAKVLVVDDNAVNRRLAAILLGRAGHEVATAAGGAEALARVADDPFDLVLMDVQMPEMDGLEATRRIRALPDAARARVPIVAVTAGATAGDDARCLAAGMDGHVTKPIDGAGLVATVERFALRTRAA